jgi:hypothetical protein
MTGPVPQMGNVAVPLLTRTVIIQKNFTQAASYLSGNCIGGLLTFDVGAATGLNMAGVYVAVPKFNYMATAGTVSVGNVVFFLFNSQPATSFADGSSPTFTAADAAFHAGNMSNTSASGIISLTASAITVSAPPIAIKCDSAGKIYGVVIAQSAHTYTTPSGFYFNLAINY